ncbi:hypothetical protein A2Y85_02510 [candidate division WOR-3 bacterium RBG_13_43_14]|uniref:DUF2341 domain-containing protein n=1 Tax=candidate division WOR-3 bacterium RBG_13_43_14 TaxID=1802590 RepID=A0A1F4UBX0_UNCW3|nr:MAG: hypothetical protein A2Y85_02510 [candidate division WOR-3 bacterium RBG_13_43_14]
MGVRVTPELDTLNSLAVIADLGVEREPDISFDGENYLVVWSDGIFGYDHRVRAARVTPTGAVIDTGIYFGIGAQLEYRPCVDFDGDRYLAVWYNYSDDPHGLFGRFINTQCQLEGDKIEIRIFGYGYPFEPDIAFCDSNYLIVWNEISATVDDDVYGQIVARNGELINGPIPIAISSDYENAPRVCASTDLFLVVWNRNSIVYGQWISILGDLIGGDFRISVTDNDNRNSPDVAISEENALIAWHEYHTNNFDIYGNTTRILSTVENKYEDLRAQYYRTIFIGNKMDIPWILNKRIYDINGCEVNRTRMIPGIYFIEIEDETYIKAVKVE